MTIEEMKARKIELGLTNEMIAEASGVPLSTVQKIFGGVTKAPRRLTIEAIAAVLSRPQKQQKKDGDGDGDGDGYAPFGQDRFGRKGRAGTHRTFEADGGDSSLYTQSIYDSAIYGATGYATGRYTAARYDASIYGASYQNKGLRKNESEEKIYNRTQPEEEDRSAQDPGSEVYRLDDHVREMMVREAEPSYKLTPKEYRNTIDDYYALPEEQRVELIDGIFYDMGAPALIHQKILGDLYILFRECADRHDMPCEVYLSPCDVRLDLDNYTMVQPDLMVICRDYDIHAIRYEGAPDLVVEILSPSTRSKDMLLKLYKYHNAGVREYWIIDPKNQTVMVHCFDEEEYTPEQYDFNAEIPIHISRGECSIDFSRIMERIKEYYEKDVKR